jgi:hypothetical protein
VDILSIGIEIYKKKSKIKKIVNFGMRHLPHLLQCSYGHVKVFDLQFCKSILKVLSNTANIFSVWRTCSAFNGEYCEKTMILFWNTGSLLTDSNKLLHIMYKLMLTPINQSINIKRLMLKIHDCVWHFNKVYFYIRNLYNKHYNYR